MTPDDELNTTQWAAAIAVMLALLVPLAAALAVWFKKRYAKAVVRLQSDTAGLAVPPQHTVQGSKPVQQDTAELPALVQRVLPANAFSRAGVEHDPTDPARRLRRRVLLLQFTAGLLYWWTLLLVVVIAFAYLDSVTNERTPNSDALPAFVMHLLLWPLLFLPVALAWAFQAGLPERRVWTATGIAMAAFAVGMAVSGMGWLVGGGFALACALLAVMLATFVRPAVRGAGPPLVAAFTVGLLSFYALVWLGTLLDPSPEEELVGWIDWGLALLVFSTLLGAAAFASWRMLLRLARRYADKRFSELQLALGAYWSLITAFSLALVLLLSFDERTGASMEWLGLAMLIVWVVWRWLLRLALQIAVRKAPAPLGPLLLLRVFKPSSRSEAFTDRFLARWRFAAPVWMIAGPDLAGAYMEPDEFFAFLRRRLHERFITHADQLPQALAALDNARDPDGRFRVSELFCANTTWQATVLALIERAGVVMLDLREYTPERAGTHFELEALLRRAPLHKVLLVVGPHEKLPQLQAGIDTIWQSVASQRPVAARPATLNIVQIGSGSDAEMWGLFRAAAAAATAHDPQRKE
ncbi:hypothetical protein [Hydrogenophaga sp.]|uniref:hypothetical protein n=1 Tax=Hydrogenophaga sp. TaxID=1904254 RepID=UPI0025C1A991|nr:hypothetical protein [Hydrogenophaga sp.]MBT9462786.1 hypothetical protein [Hydrogenophaga sp.]